LRAIRRILGLLLMVFSLTMLPPVGVSLYYGDGSHTSFVAAAAWLIAVGGLKVVRCRCASWTRCGDSSPCTSACSPC